MKKNNITPFEIDVAKWYSDLVLQSDLVSYAPVKGTMFWKPYGFQIWNNITKIMNNEFEKIGIEQVQFPLLFPETLLNKEKDHVEGFSPEVLKVTKVGSKELNEPLVIRPTSEVLFGTFFKENLNSYSQLPLKLNQWVNIMRWENNTRPFLRNSEFFWQEGHTVHSIDKDAKDFSIEIINLYEDFAKNILLLPIIQGEKTKSERFAGAENTYTIETILKDGQALQSGTSHYLGQNFTKAFNVKVQDKNNKMTNPHQTSWGVSTRLIGAIIMSHSDNKGLVLPSKIAPFNIVVLTVFGDKNKNVLEVSQKIVDKLSKENKVKLDDSNKGIGFKSQEWEVKGVPIRIEVGPKDLEKGMATISIRNESEKRKYKINKINNKLIEKLLIKYDERIFKNAEKVSNEKKIDIKSLDEMKTHIEAGNYCVGYWIENPEAEKKIKEDLGVTIRCLIEDKKKGKDIVTKKETNKKAIFARAY